MSQLPSLSYVKVIRSLQRHGYVVVRQRGSHVRIQKRFPDGTIKKTTVPVHNPIKKNTLRKILKDANISIEEFISKAPVSSDRAPVRVPNWPVLGAL